MDTILDFEDTRKSTIIGTLAGFDLYTSTLAVKREGERPMKVKRRWKERLFSRPWTPFEAYKIVMVPNYKPAIMKIGNKIIYHPALEEAIRRMIEVSKRK